MKVTAKQKYFKSQFMRHVRKMIRQVKKDPYLVGVADDLRIEMVKWEPHSNQGLFVIYDAAHGRSCYTNKYCQWEWLRFNEGYDRSYYYLWRAVNYILVNKRRDELSKIVD
jgi:hypothetical protein